MPAPNPKYLDLDIQEHTDRNGIVHCWMCGRVLANVRRRSAHPTLLCKRPGREGCFWIRQREVNREWMRDLRMRRSILAGRLPGPPLSTTYEQALRYDAKGRPRS
jgi:hypothetical protein